MTTKTKKVKCFKVFDTRKCNYVSSSGKSTWLRRYAAIDVAKRNANYAIHEFEATLSSKYFPYEVAELERKAKQVKQAEIRERKRRRAESAKSKISSKITALEMQILRLKRKLNEF